MSRPSWHSYFLGLAFVVAQRSNDPHTQHGTVLVDNHQHIVGTGYNALPRKVNDAKFPITRPEKYKFFQHSEINCLANCTVNLWSIPGGATAYVTGKCCNNCLQQLWQNNVTTVYMATRQGTKLESEETERDFQLIVKETGINIIWLDTDIDWIKNIQT